MASRRQLIRDVLLGTALVLLSFSAGWFLSDADASPVIIVQNPKAPVMHVPASAPRPTVKARSNKYDVHTYVPSNAISLLPILKEQEQAVWPTMKAPSYAGSLIEQESCISLTYRTCWSTKAQFKTAREEGGGLSQFTRVWNANGSLRFDALAEVKTMDPKGLAGLNWTTLYTSADLNMRAILDKVKDCHRRLQFLAPKISSANLFAECDSAYNGGYGGLLSDRRLCSQTPGCNPDVWFGSVEKTSLKSKLKWQGYGASAFDINREHVTNSWLIRRPKYIPYLGADIQ